MDPVTCFGSSILLDQGRGRCDRRSDLALAPERTEARSPVTPTPFPYEPESPQRVTQLAGGATGVLTTAGAQHDLNRNDRESLVLDLGRDGAEQVFEPLVKRSAPVTLGRCLFDRVLSALLRRRIGV